MSINQILTQKAISDDEDDDDDENEDIFRATHNTHVIRELNYKLYQRTYI